MTRADKIVKTSIIGIVVNLILVAFKATIGILVNSIAITLDAVNNLTDALSSIITIIGTKLAGKPPDKKHPYGYGRIEYFSSVIISIIVLWAGVTALLDSWPKIFHPDVTSYSPVPLFIIAVAVVVKIALGRYVKKVGLDINSPSLVASGNDALFDAILSFSTLVAGIISILWNISIEGILGVIISLVIIKASVEMLKETVDSMIGSRVDAKLSKKIKESICEVTGVYGVYDLSLHNYGPESMQGSVHVEIDGDLSAIEIHRITRSISIKIYEEFSIILTVGVYARNNEYEDICSSLDEIVKEHDEILEIHGFIVYEETNTATFDMVVDFEADREKVKADVMDIMNKKHPEFKFYIIDDYDLSD